LATEDTNDGRKLYAATGMPGAGLTGATNGKAPPERPALKPYWGKPAVRNFRGTMETSASFEARSALSPYPTVAMTHIAIQEALDGKVVDWMEHVSDDQYGK